MDAVNGPTSCRQLKALKSRKLKIQYMVAVKSVKPIISIEKAAWLVVHVLESSCFADLAGYRHLLGKLSLKWVKYGTWKLIDKLRKRNIKPVNQSPYTRHSTPNWPATITTNTLTGKNIARKSGPNGNYKYSNKSTSVGQFLFKELNYGLTQANVEWLALISIPAFKRT